MKRKILAIAATALVLGASADAKTCEKDYLVVTVGAVHADENRRSLIKDKAERTWGFNAGAKYGPGFAYWQNAKRTSIKCKRIDGLWFCVARARACSR
ncbi:MAG: hypothetical protein KDK00_03335 [Rhodobacteraceae bacterium]|nr:hypothetical protein [Paracoccaceae bacterium]